MLGIRQSQYLTPDLISNQPLQAPLVPQAASFLHRTQEKEGRVWPARCAALLQPSLRLAPPRERSVGLAALRPGPHGSHLSCALPLRHLLKSAHISLHGISKDKSKTHGIIEGKKKSHHLQIEFLKKNESTKKQDMFHTLFILHSHLSYLT